MRQRLLVEELFRRRKSTDHERYIEVFRRSAVDPNPHQVEAVAFALGRLSEGGALLCDEVGLGKTIETGLLITQLRAEGKTNVLIIVPLPLARQWQVELKDLFSLKSTVIGSDNTGLHNEPGIYIAGREFAGSPRWSAVLGERNWELIVIDEAHELLGNLHSRFSRRDGSYQPNLKKGGARRAALIKRLVGDRPVILLTATPLQNNLLELWSLVHLVDRASIALGELHQFNELFAAGDGRAIKEGTEEELRRRMRAVVCRTLRSDAQKFMRTPFTARHCQTINFHMAANERELYNGVSAWLEGPMAAYRPGRRRMMGLNLRKRMGSSVQALAASLSNLRKKLQDPDPDAELPEGVDHGQIEDDIQELMRLENMAARALTGPSPKFDALMDFINKLHTGAVSGVASDKVVVFTESLKTLGSIVSSLENHGLRGQVTAFSGQNETPAAMAALRLWEQEVGAHLDHTQRPERSSAIRAALIHEFRTRTRVLVTTEAGAKGLNLQFCNCLVNFDLPWNPQRIEQRIGRVHRYGQEHDVVIVNFINQDNEGESRVYELLNEKLRLFEGLLGASDSILGQVAATINFERRIEDLFANCRTPEERRREFDRIELELDEQARKAREAKLQKARNLKFSLDEDVQARLRLTAKELPIAISRRDEAILALLEEEAPVHRLPVDGDRLVFEWRGKRYHLGPPNPSDACGEPLALDHPVLQTLAAQARKITNEKNFRIRGTPADWFVYRLTIAGHDVEDRLLVLGPKGREGLEEALAASETIDSVSEHASDPPELAEARDRIRHEAEREQEPRLERTLHQLAARKDDERRFLDQRERELENAVEQAKRRMEGARHDEERRQAEVSYRRARGSLDALKGERDSRLWEASRALAARESKIYDERFVSVQAERLYRVERRP